MAPKSSTESPCYLLHDLQALDPTAREVDLDTFAWIQPTIIDDEDLTFGGKSLSAWYEEDRSRLSSGCSDSASPSSTASSASSGSVTSDDDRRSYYYFDEEERRGRERVRRHHRQGGSGKKAHRK